MRRASLLLVFLLLAGCDKLTGAAEQKVADAEAIGFACRVSGKSPEACMKENEAQSPSSVLEGWKAADGDIKEGKLDPSMSNKATAEHDDGADQPAASEEKPADEKKDEAAADTKHDEKPADAPAKDGHAADEAKAKH